MRSRTSSYLQIFFFICVFISGCEKNISPTFQQNQVGGYGLIVIEKGTIPFTFDSRVQMEITPDIKYSFEVTKDAILISPNEGLKIGTEIVIKINQLDEEITLKEIVRTPCLTYLADITSNAEIWSTCGGGSFQMSQTSGRVVDYAVSNNGDWIVYAVENSESGTDIWKMGRMGENSVVLLPCGKKVCDQLAINSQGSHVAFRSFDGEEKINLFQIENRNLILVERGKASNVDFSPDDKMFRYFENTSGYLRIIDLENMKLIASQKTDSDLIGNWKKDSEGFMFGQYNNWGGIAVIDLKEKNMIENSESLILDGAESSIYLYEPNYSINGEFIALARTGFNANRKQIFELDRNGNVINEITNNFQYSHSMISWNSIEDLLVFQRFAHTSSDAAPEIWVWEKSDNSLRLIDENAAHGEWVY
jgi:hypothetical protein